MDGQYIYPGELALLVAFMFAPPLLIAFVIQSLLIATLSISTNGRFARSFLACTLTLIGSIVIGVLIHEFAPRSLGPILGVRDISIAGQSWPVMPLAFVSVAFVAPLVTWWVVWREKSLTRRSSGTRQKRASPSTLR